MTTGVEDTAPPPQRGVFRTIAIAGVGGVFGAALAILAALAAPGLINPWVAQETKARLARQEEDINLLFQETKRCNNQLSALASLERVKELEDRLAKQEDDSAVANKRLEGQLTALTPRSQVKELEDRLAKQEQDEQRLQEQFVAMGKERVQALEDRSAKQEKDINLALEETKRIQAQVSAEAVTRALEVGYLKARTSDATFKELLKTHGYLKHPTLTALREEVRAGTETVGNDDYRYFYFPNLHSYNSRAAGDFYRTFPTREMSMERIQRALFP